MSNTATAFRVQIASCAFAALLAFPALRTEARTLALWPIEMDPETGVFDGRCACYSTSYDLLLTESGSTGIVQGVGWNLPPNPQTGTLFFPPTSRTAVKGSREGTGKYTMYAPKLANLISNTNNFTVEGWVKLDPNPSQTADYGQGTGWTIFLQAGAGSNAGNGGWILSWRGNEGARQFWLTVPKDSGGAHNYDNVIGPSSLSAAFEASMVGSWHHLALTHNVANGNSVWKLYVDGENTIDGTAATVQTAPSGSFTPVASYGALYFGGRPDGNANRMNASFDYWRVSDTALEPSAFLCAGGAGTMVDTSGESAVVYLTPDVNNNNFNSQWISTGVSLKGDARKTCTAEIWVYPLQRYMDQHLIEQYAGGTGRQNFVIRTDGTLFVQLLGYNGDYQIQSTETVPLYTWSHVAWVADNDVWRLYLNGELVAEESGHDGQLLDASSADGFMIGNSRSSNPNGASNAYFAEGRVWKCARTREEIRAAMNTRIANAWAVEDLVGYWPLNDGAAIYAENGDKLRNYAAASVAFTPSGRSSWDCSYASGNRVRWISSQLPVTGTLAGEQFSLCNENNAANKTNAVDTGISATPAEFTYMGWYRVLESGTSTKINYLFGKSKGGNGRALFYEQNGALTLWMGGGSGGKTNESLTVENCLPRGRWTHVALTKNASAVRFYVNGEMVGESTAFTLNLLNANLHIGGFEAGGSRGGFYGAFRNVGFWSKVLSADAIKKHMFALPDVTDPCLLGYWPLDEGTGNVVRNLKEGASAAGPLENGFFIWTKGANMPMVEGTVQPSGMGIVIR